MRVVDDEHQGTQSRQLRRQPVQAVHRRMGIRRPHRRHLSRRQDGSCERCRALEGALPVVRAELANRPLEQLTHDSEAELALELRGGASQHPGARHPTLGRRELDERGLAHSSRRPDDDRRAVALHQQPDAVPQDVELRLSLK